MSESLMAAAAAEREPRTTQRRGKSRIPVFKTIEEEAEFWDTHDLTEFEDELEEVTDVKFVVTRGRPTKSLTVRLAPDTLEELTKLAREHGVAASRLVRLWIAERLYEQKRRPSRAIARRGR